MLKSRASLPSLENDKSTSLDIEAQSHRTLLNARKRRWTNIDRLQLRVPLIIIEHLAEALQLLPSSSNVDFIISRAYVGRRLRPLQMQPLKNAFSRPEKLHTKATTFAQVFLTDPVSWSRCPLAARFPDRSARQNDCLRTRRPNLSHNESGGPEPRPSSSTFGDCPAAVGPLGSHKTDVPGCQATPPDCNLSDSDSPNSYAQLLSGLILASRFPSSELAPIIPSFHAVTRARELANTNRVHC